MTVAVSVPACVGVAVTAGVGITSSVAARVRATGVRIVPARVRVPVAVTVSVATRVRATCVRIVAARVRVTVAVAVTVSVSVAVGRMSQTGNCERSSSERGRDHGAAPHTSTGVEIGCHRRRAKLEENIGACAL